MADVSGDGPDPDGDRAQLLLVTALALAVLFVTLALLLNTAIYTENLATRDAVGGARDAVTFQHAVREDTADLVTFANYHANTSTSALQHELEREVGNFSEGLARQHAARGRVANVSLQSTHNGTRIGRAGSGLFENTDGNETWLVVDGVTEARAFRLHVLASSLATNGTAPDDLENGGVFRVNFTEGTDDYRVFVYADGGDVVVTTNTTGTVRTCRYAPGAPDENVTVDLSAGTVADAPCPGLRVVPTLNAGPDYRVDFRHGENASGTYEVTVNDSSTVGKAPYETDAIYDATVGVTFDSSDVHYRSRFRVAPGETDG